MIHRDRRSSGTERRLLALMAAVALLGTALPGVIGRGIGGSGGISGSGASVASGGAESFDSARMPDDAEMSGSTGMTAGGAAPAKSVDDAASVKSYNSVASAKSGGGTVPDKACAAIPVAARGSSRVPLRIDGVRALWIASAYSIDYPSGDGGCIAELRAEIYRIVKNAADMGMNAIFFQVRPAADALYRSDIFPVSAALGGELPFGFDPLTELCTAAHSRDISVLAWVNPLRVTLSVCETREQALASLPVSSPAALHPEYCAFPGGRLWFDPGYPEVRRLVADGVAEIVREYPVDGVVFDDYFYPYPSAADGWDDSDSYARYGGGAELDDFRRANINELIALCSEAVHGAANDGIVNGGAVNSGAADAVATVDGVRCVFGVSPFGIWRNSSLDPRGSDTRGFSAYDGIYADALEWVRTRAVDFLSPQIYFRRDDPAAPALELMRWWGDATAGSGVPLIFSLADYKASLWQDGGEVAEQERLSRDISGCIGCAHYGYGALCANDFGVRSCLTAAVPVQPAQ